MTTRAMMVHGGHGLRVARLPGKLAPVATLAIGLATAVAIASTIVFFIALLAATVHAVIASPSAKHHRACVRARKRRRARDVYRMHDLEVAHAPTGELEELHWLVERMFEASEDPEGDPLELEALLDRYRDVAIARAACAGVLARTNCTWLAHRMETARSVHPLSAEVIARRIRHAREVEQEQHRLEEALAEIAELVRWCAERASTPEVIDGDRGTIEAVLEQLDARDAVDAEMS